MLYTIVLDGDVIL